MLKDNVYLFSILKEENRTGHDPNAFVLYFKNNLLFTADFAGDNPYWRYYDDNGETSSTVQQVLEQYYGAYFQFSEEVLKTLQPGTVRVSNP